MINEHKYQEMRWQKDSSLFSMNKTLHLAVDKSGRKIWKKYNQCKVAVPDRPGLSKGMATMQKLLKDGWILVD